MDNFARIVIGYHGCTIELASRLISGELAISAWPHSENAYDWLGHGVYFWEYGPQRAREWSVQNGRDGGVVGAYIQLGKCLDLTDTRYTAFLAEAYDSVREMYAAQKLPLPVNKQKRNELDCLVINEVTDLYGDGDEEAERFQTVRCPFLEGKPAFEGSMIQRQSHIQVTVIDSDCILGVFRPNLDP